MKKLGFPFLLIILFLLMLSCKSQKKTSYVEPLQQDLKGIVNFNSNYPFDSARIVPFFNSHTELVNYKPDVMEIYRKNNFKHIWFDSYGMLEFGNSLYSKITNIETEGVSSKFPYSDQIAGIFQAEIENTLNETETELMLSCMFLFYAEKVYKGIDDKTATALEWLLPKKQISYSSLLDSILLKPELLDQNDQSLFRQYYKLRNVLMKYREIEKIGGWKPIVMDPKVKSFRPGDTAKAILQIRERLFASGELNQNSGSNSYDTELLLALKKYQIHNGSKPEPAITQKLVAKMNVPVGERIKQIVVNMERCRWISPEVIHSHELIFVNIPSFNLYFYRKGIKDFESPVVVGKNMSKTVIFSGNMSYIVFSPYWNLPQSIINKEVKPGIAKNSNYLELHNMEWNNGQVRQKPGKKNSLGLVKFMFPNSNDIYLHDTPSKNLFEREIRAFSHGCIRVGKPRDLALEILKDDKNWTPQKIDAAMNAGKETSYSIKNKIPVYIGYFTALVDEQGEINFYEDVYKLDERLAKIIMN